MCLRCGNISRNLRQILVQHRSVVCDYKIYYYQHHHFNEQIHHAVGNLHLIEFFIYSTVIFHFPKEQKTI